MPPSSRRAVAATTVVATQRVAKKRVWIMSPRAITVRKAHAGGSMHPTAWRTSWTYTAVAITPYTASRAKAMPTFLRIREGRTAMTAPIVRPDMLRTNLLLRQGLRYFHRRERAARLIPCFG